MRLNGAFGSPDTDFGDNGLSTTRLVDGANFATGLALPSDGKSVVAGSAQIDGVPAGFVARFGADARLDRSFGSEGLVTPVAGAVSSQFQAVAVDADGRIVATGFRAGSPDELLLCRFWP